jgi:tetratricopeptide (TPR) repeat protein
MVSLLLEYDREKAEREWNRAMELSPSDSSVRMEYAFYMLCGVHGDFDRATELARQSLELDPLSALAHAFCALVHGFADRHEDTVAEARKALSIDPSSFIAHYQLGLGLVRSGDWEGALKAMTPVLGPSGRHPWIMLVVGLAYEAGGRHAEGMAIYHELIARAEVEFVQPSLLLLLAHGLKLKEESARLLTLAGEVRDMTIPALLLHFNENRGLSSTPAGLALLHKMGWDDEVRRLA